MAVDAAVRPLDRGDDPGDDPTRDCREVVDLLPAGATRLDRVVPDGELLERDGRLDPSLERTPLPDLFPERFTAGTGAEQAALAAAHAADAHPLGWIAEVNPGWTEDVATDRPGRTTNCAECARAFQEGLEGHPTVAAAIDEAGLPARSAQGWSGGEISRYTEQWAGRELAPASYAEIGDVVRRTGGSAIVHAGGADRRFGHAFNAFWDDRGERVLWADAQSGLLGPWPPVDLRDRFPEARVMYFERGASTHDR